MGEKKRETVALGYCHGGKLDQPFHVSIMSFIHWDGQHGQLFDGEISTGGLYIDDNRNRLVESFLEGTESEWLLILDTDIIFGPNVPELLLASAKANDAKIMSALYFGFMDGKNITPIWLDANTKGEFETLGRLKIMGVQSLGAVGMGCVLIHRNVFEQMAARWYDDPWHWFGRDIGVVDNKPTRLGEDLTFCKRARILGFDIMGDTRIPVQHIKQRILTVDSFVEEKKHDPTAQVRELGPGDLCDESCQLAPVPAE